MGMRNNTCPLSLPRCSSIQLLPSLSILSYPFLPFHHNARFCTSAVSIREFPSLNEQFFQSGWSSMLPSKDQTKYLWKVKSTGTWRWNRMNCCYMLTLKHTPREKCWNAWSELKARFRHFCAAEITLTISHRGYVYGATSREGRR